MSEFKFVQWGKGTPVDYQRLNTMMINEQYLKDITDTVPKGIIKQLTCTSDITLGAYPNATSLPNMDNISFSVDVNRSIKFTISGKAFKNMETTPANAYQLNLFLLIDGTVVSSTVTNVTATLTYNDFPTLIYTTPNPLSKGSHTVSVQAYYFALVGSPTAPSILQPIQCTIEDVGVTP